MTGFSNTCKNTIIERRDGRFGNTGVDLDKLSKERRSQIMSRIRGKDTSPEMKVRSLVHRLGYRYRLHYEKLPGKPDLAFPIRKKVIFIHGCFWHGHEGCSKGRLPKSNLEYWEPKIARNKERDRENMKSISSDGWRILTVWQCELKNTESSEKRIVIFLEAQ